MIPNEGRHTMKIIHATDIPAAPVTADGAAGATIRELITDREGAPTFAMRLFEVEPGGHTPFHAHGWEHEVFILEGAGELALAGAAHPFAAGDAVFVPGGEEHRFLNTGQATLRFLCLIPVEDPCCR
jgi:quercetin dioxygenase-like cupin family protein